MSLNNRTKYIYLISFYIDQLKNQQKFLLFSNNLLFRTMERLSRRLAREAIPAATTLTWGRRGVLAKTSYEKNFFPY